MGTVVGKHILRTGFTECLESMIAKHSDKQYMNDVLKDQLNGQINPIDKQAAFQKIGHGKGFDVNEEKRRRLK